MNKHLVFARSARTGAAFLLLIFLILLVVLGATQTMVRSEMSNRHHERGRLRVRSMQSAMDAATNIDGKRPDSIRLPVAPEANEFIEVTVNQDESSVRAQWWRGDRVLDQMTQKLDLKTESGE